ncbi:hypothetical protein GGU11DRAFT_750404 [Lentinula aff. detonsa]|nr:hypothetical protein GGU11DRAFT_750404 [Lentinula aff. detonsa]
MFEILWRSGDRSWLPFDRVQQLAALDEYFEALGIQEVSQLRRESNDKVPIEGMEGEFLGSIEFLDLNAGGKVDLQIATLSLTMSDSDSDSSIFNGSIDVNQVTPPPAEPTTELHTTVASAPVNTQNEEPEWHFGRIPIVQFDWSLDKVYFIDPQNVEFGITITDLLRFMWASGALTKKWTLSGDLIPEYGRIIRSLWVHVPLRTNYRFAYEDQDGKIQRSRKVVPYEYVFTATEIDSLKAKGFITGNFFRDMSNAHPRPGNSQQSEPINSKKRKRSEGSGFDDLLKRYGGSTNGRDTIFHSLFVAASVGAKNMKFAEERRDGKRHRETLKKTRVTLDSDAASTTMGLKEKMSMWTLRNESAGPSGDKAGAA